MITATENRLVPEKWVEKYGDMLFNYTRVRVSKEELAQDLVQDSFLAAFKARDSFQGKSNEKTWLFSILKRKIIDYFRSAEHRYYKVNFEDYHTDFDSPFEDEGLTAGKWSESRAPQDWKLDDEEHLKTEFLVYLQKCIAHLPDKNASVFVMKNMENTPTEKICKELGISSSNLWVIMHRVRLQLRECLEKYGFTKGSL